MLSDVMPWISILKGAAFVAAYNGAVMFVSSSASRYARWGRRASLSACLLDTLMISLAVGMSRHGASSVYLLYALSIMGASHISRGWHRIAIVAAASIIGNLVATAAALHGAPAGALFTAIRHSSSVLVAAATLASSLAIFKQRDDTLQRRDRKLSALLEFGTRFASGEDAARVMEQTLRAAIRETDASGGYILLLDPAAHALYAEVAVGIGAECPCPKVRAIGEGIEGYVAETGKPLVLSRDESGGANGSLSYEGEAILCIPMVESRSAGAENRRIGVFTLVSGRKGARFLDEDVDLARMLSSLSTMAIVNAQLYQEQREAFVRALQSLARSLEAKDRYTQGHAFRVSELSARIAAKLKVTASVIDDMRNGALLHDIGKIGIPDAVLRKPGRLTDEEFEIMKQHTVIGYDICKPLNLGDGILMLIRNHHEKLDGTGYPDGLKFGELPLPLRIVCLADAFDAMSSSRPYRNVMDVGARNEQLNRFAGTQFDPIIVEVLKSMVTSGELNDLYQQYWTVTPEGDVQLTAPPEPAFEPGPAVEREPDIELFPSTQKAA
jgi:putative nucleotidyltransferase with HDIG domain